MSIDLPGITTELTEESLRQFAASVFGSATEAESWFTRPVTALGLRRPVDLVRTDEGREAVRTILGRLAYCVYT